MRMASSRQYVILGAKRAIATIAGAEQAEGRNNHEDRRTCRVHGTVRPDAAQRRRPPPSAEADCKAVVGTLAVRPGRSDRRHQPRHARRHQGRRRRDPDRRRHADGQPAGRRHTAVRHPLQQDHPEQLRRRARRRIRQEQAELYGGYLSQPEPRRHAYRRHGPHRHPGLLLQPDADGEIRHPELPEAAWHREHEDPSPRAASSSTR